MAKKNFLPFSPSFTSVQKCESLKLSVGDGDNNDDKECTLSQDLLKE